MINADKKKEMKNLSEMLLETRNLTKQYGHHKLWTVSICILKKVLFMVLSVGMELERQLV